MDVLGVVFVVTNLLVCVEVESAQNPLEYDDDYIEIRHDDGVLAGMRAVPISSGNRHVSTMQDDDDYDDSSVGAFQDDFDGSRDEVIHVIRRQPEVAEQVIEFDPLGGQVHKGVVRRNKVKDDSLKTKIGKYLIHGSHDRVDSRHLHEDGHLVFDEIENDVNKNDIAKIKVAIKDKKKRDKDLAKRLGQYEKRLSRANTLRRKTSSKAMKKLTKLLNKEDKEGQKRKKKLDGKEEKIVHGEQEADRFLDSALTEREVKDIVDAVHNTHQSPRGASRSDILVVQAPNHNDKNKNKKRKENDAKGLYKAEEKRLKREERALEHFSKLDKFNEGALQHSSLLKEAKQQSPRQDQDDYSREIPRSQQPESINDALRHSISRDTLQHPWSEEWVVHPHLSVGSSVHNAVAHRRSYSANSADEALEELLSEYDRWKHLRGVPESSTRESKAKDLKELTKQYAKWRKRQREVEKERGGGFGAKNLKQLNDKDALLKGSLEDFETWKRLRGRESKARTRG